MLPPPARTDPAVTVCIPTYNGEKWIARCLDSIHRQTFRDFDVLIIDDRSHDRTVEMIRESPHPADVEVKVSVNPVNLGLVRNWNRCLQFARGRWVKFVFQDDWLDPRCLEIFMRHAGERDRFLVSDREFSFEGGASPEGYGFLLEQRRWMKSKMKELEYVADVDRSADLIAMQAPVNFFGEPSNVMFRRDALFEIGVFDPRYVQISDLDYWVRLSLRHGFRFIDEPLSTFRITPDSCTTKNNQERAFQMNVLDSLLLLLATILLVQQSVGHRSLRQRVIRDLAKRLNGYQREARLPENRENLDRLRDIASFYVTTEFRF